MIKTFLGANRDKMGFAQLSKYSSTLSDSYSLEQALGNVGFALWLESIPYGW